MGKKVKVVVWRNKEQKTFWVTIAEVAEKKIAQGKTAPGVEESNTWGFAVQELSPAMAEKVGLPDNTGVMITEVEPGSAAQQKGLQAGDVIIEVEHNPIKDLAEFRKLIEPYKKKKTLLLTVRQKVNEYHTFYVVLEKKG